MSDDDDFYSDGDSKQLPNHSSLLPIVEVPSESDSRAPSTARTESEAPNTQRSFEDDYSDEYVMLLLNNKIDGHYEYENV